MELLPKPRWDWGYYRRSVSAGEGTFFLQRIYDACRWESFTGFLIVGREGSGKSMLALKILRSVYGSWRTALANMFFRWEDLESELDAVNRAGATKPAVAWDDAGVYASRYLYRIDSKAALRIAVLTQLIREHSRALLLTTPNPEDIAKVLRVRTGWYVCRLKRVDKEHSRVRCWEMESQIIKHGRPKPVASGVVNIMVPDEVYVQYRGLRRRYYLMAKADLERL